MSSSMGGLELEEVSPLSLIWMIGSMNKRLQVCNSSATTDSMNWEIEQVAADLCFFFFPEGSGRKAHVPSSERSAEQVTRSYNTVAHRSHWSWRRGDQWARRKVDIGKEPGRAEPAKTRCCGERDERARVRPLPVAIQGNGWWLLRPRPRGDALWAWRRRCGRS